jgi:hypothetical protein
MGGDVVGIIPAVLDAEISPVVGRAARVVLTTERVVGKEPPTGGRMATDLRYTWGGPFL